MSFAALRNAARLNDNEADPKGCWSFTTSTASLLIPLEHLSQWHIEDLGDTECSL